MSEPASITLQSSRGVIVASIQTDLTDPVMDSLRQALLSRIQNSNAHGVVFDVSALALLDSTEFLALRELFEMCRLMGASSVLVGMRPGIVSSLVEVGAPVEDVTAAINMDAAFALLNPGTEPAEDAGDDDEALDPDAASGADDEQRG